MHHNVLLVAAGLFCSPIFAAPNVNNVCGMETSKNLRHEYLHCLLRTISLTLISDSTPAKATVNGKLTRQSCPWVRSGLRSMARPPTM